MATKPNYPYQNRLLVDLKGEQWEDLPGLEGYIRVSNWGRVKRLAREGVNSKGHVVRYREMILAPRVWGAPNHYVGDCTYHLFAHLEIEGQRYHLSIRRLVYHCFVQPIDLHDKTINIICRDGNGLNLRPRNLKAVLLRKASQRILQLKRRPPQITNVNPVKAMQASLANTCKPITQYSKKGKKIKNFPSIMEAARQTGLTHSHISHAAAGIERSAGGSYWAFGTEPHFDVEAYLNKRRHSYKEKKGTKLTQYDLKGNRIAQFLTLHDAAAAVEKHYTSISAALRGITASAYGFIWKRGWGQAQIDVSNQAFGNELRAQRRLKQVKQYSAQGKYLQTFSSVRAAAVALDVSPSAISGVLNKKKLVKGFRWKAGGK